MGRYQCHKCNREFARSSCLRRHLSSCVCKENQKDMSESDQESVVSTKRSYGLGKAIFGKYDTDKLVEDGPTDNSTDEDEEDTDDEDDEKDEDEDDEDEEEEYEEEEDVSKKTKKHKIRPWDVLVNIAAETLQDTSTQLWRKRWQDIKTRTYKRLKKWHMRN